MPALSVLKARIASDLHRTDLTDDIAYAIADSVAHYKTRRFRFNQARSTFNVTSGTEYYGTSVIPNDILQVDVLSITVNGRKYVLREWSYETMERIASTTNTFGQPTAWAWYDDEIRFYPVPDATYTVTISYHQSIGVPATDGASNAWTNEAEELIRNAAKRRLCLGKLRDPEGAQLAATYEGEALERLRKEARMVDTGTLKANV